MPRITWADLPDDVRAWVEDILGSRVVAAESQPGGYSLGTADRVTCADGTRAFVKAVHPSLNENTPSIHRREAEILAALPRDLPVPHLLAALDDDWVVLVEEDIDGEHPDLPWSPERFAALIATLAGLARRLTPSPLPDLPCVVVAESHLWNSWQWLIDEPDPQLDPWVAARLRQFVAASERNRADAAGTTLLHADTRSDNLLHTAQGLVVIDWPYATNGAAWFDAGLAFVEYATSGHPSAVLDRALADVARTFGVEVAVLVDFEITLAGYFLHNARRPAEPGMQNVRDFQRYQGEALIEWLKLSRLVPV